MPSRFFKSWLPDTEMPVYKLSIDKMLCLKKKVVARQASNTIRIIQILFFKLKMESSTLLALR